MSLTMSLFSYSMEFHLILKIVSHSLPMSLDSLQCPPFFYSFLWILISDYFFYLFSFIFLCFLFIYFFSNEFCKFGHYDFCSMVNLINYFYHISQSDIILFFVTLKSWYIYFFKIWIWHLWYSLIIFFIIFSFYFDERFTFPFIDP